MKNNLITQLGMLITLTLLSLIGQAQTTSLLIGSVKNGIGNISNLENARHVLLKNLPASSVVTDLKLEYSTWYGKYFLTAKVSGSDISSVGIQLEQSGDTISALSGPGVEITCTGSNCNSCQASFQGRPCCKCLDSSSTDHRCDMTTTLTISI